LVEYQKEQLEKRKNGKGGIWRIPPSFDGCVRAPVPRFTVLKETDKKVLYDFFSRLAESLRGVLVPGAHVLVATNPLVSSFVYQPFLNAGFEKRGEIIRLVQTLRGGDRPKNAEEEFDMVSVSQFSFLAAWKISSNGFL